MMMAAMIEIGMIGIFEEVLRDAGLVDLGWVRLPEEVCRGAVRLCAELGWRRVSWPWREAGGRLPAEEGRCWDGRCCDERCCDERVRPLS